MRVIILDRARQEGARLRQALSVLGHEVNLVSTREALERATPSHTPPDVVIAMLQDGAVTSWMPLLSSQCQLRHIYLIASLTALSSTAVKRAWDLGADDVMKYGASPEEVAGRVDAPSRIRRWFGTLMIDAEEGDFDIEALNAWRDLGAIVGQEFSQMVGSVDPTQIRSSPELQFGAEIGLSLPTQEIGIKIGIGVERAAVETFAGALFGERVGDDIITDAVRELANTAAGAMKRAALVEGHAFSVGLPTNCPSLPTDPNHAWVLTGDAFRLVVWSMLERDRTRRMTVSTLREGMIVAQEVRNGAGRLLIAAGTRLTERTLAKLVEVVGQSALVDVIQAA